ncbi:MAG TPA: hypothetical protein VHU15_17130 [Stellaceae bacterium]|nr:hypothetical protein [Stellaceae bacterium]
MSGTGKSPAQGKIMGTRLCFVAGLAGLIAVVAVPQPAAAQDVNRVVRTLDRILNPEDARRNEERARREHRVEEERYWRDYRTGLESEHHDRGERRYGSEEARRYQDEARRHEEEARRRHRAEDERYWHDYRLGLDRH